MINLSRVKNKKINLEVKILYLEKILLAAFYSRLEITNKKIVNFEVRLAESIQFEVARQKY